MKLIDEAALSACRRRGRCEWCGCVCEVDAHHIFSKGAGRVDIAANLIALCRFPNGANCHGEVHNGQILRIDLLAVAACRERVSQGWIEQEVYRIRRLPKQPTVPTDRRETVRRSKAKARCKSRKQSLEAWKLRHLSQA